MQPETQNSSFLEKVRRVTQSRFPYINKTARAIFAATALTAMIAKEAEGGKLLIKESDSAKKELLRNQFRHLDYAGTTRVPATKVAGQNSKLRMDKVEEFITQLQLDRNWKSKSQAIEQYAQMLSRGPVRKITHAGTDGASSVYEYDPNWNRDGYYIFSEYENLCKTLIPTDKKGVNWRPERNDLTLREEFLGLKDVMDAAVLDSVRASTSVQKATTKGLGTIPLVGIGIILFLSASSKLKTNNKPNILAGLVCAATVVGVLQAFTPGPMGSPSQMKKTLKKAFHEAHYQQQAGSGYYNYGLYIMPQYDKKVSALTAEQKADYEALQEIKAASKKLTYVLPTLARPHPNNSVKPTKAQFPKAAPIKQKHPQNPLRVVMTQDKSHTLTN